MKIYANRNFSSDFLKRINIPEYGAYVWTPYLNIKECYRCKFDVANEEDEVPVWVIDIDEYCEDPYDYDYCMGDWFDEYTYEDLVYNLIKKYNHYLVCVYSCTWNGADGYKIADDIKDALIRNYDCSQYFVGGSKGGKSIAIREHSHDVPMGHSTIIIGLTDKEYEKLSYWDVSFESVFEFANRKSKSIIEI